MYYKNEKKPWKYSWYIPGNSSVDENNDKEAYQSLKIVAKTVSTHVRGDEEAGPTVPRWKILCIVQFLEII